jgi:hypothetical protein
MNKHYFFELSKNELELLKQEYLNSNIVLFTKKYNISNNTCIILFWKKWMKWIVWPKFKIKHKNIKTNINTTNKFNSDFFNQWLYKNNIDIYYIKVFKNQ